MLFPSRSVFNKFALYQARFYAFSERRNNSELILFVAEFLTDNLWPEPAKTHVPDRRNL
jgi:hypothetical protein